jgi:hypothetical protein
MCISLSLSRLVSSLCGRTGSEGGRAGGGAEGAEGSKTSNDGRDGVQLNFNRNLNNFNFNLDCKWAIEEWGGFIVCCLVSDIGLRCKSSQRMHMHTTGFNSRRSHSHSRSMVRMKSWSSCLIGSHHVANPKFASVLVENSRSIGTLGFRVAKACNNFCPGRTIATSTADVELTNRHRKHRIIIDGKWSCVTDCSFQIHVLLRQYMFWTLIDADHDHDWMDSTQSTRFYAHSTDYNLNYQARSIVLSKPKTDRKWNRQRTNVMPPFRW